MDKFMKIDKDFLPIYEFNKTFDEKVRKEGADLFAFSVERNDGYSECFSIDVLKEGVDDALNFRRAERFIKTALWTVGGYKLKIIANDTLYKSLENAYSHGGKRDFDVKFFEKVYDAPFSVERVTALLKSKRELVAADKNECGARIGLDAGGSDIKISAVENGNVLFSKEILWQPKVNSNPAYHVKFINNALNEAATHLKKIDAIGVSSAGIYVKNEARVASLFIKVPENDYDAVRRIYIDAAKRLGAPVTVANDGDVSALAGSMSLGEGAVMGLAMGTSEAVGYVAAMAGAISMDMKSVLGIAMGTSEAAGFVDDKNRLWGWLNELAFVPVDMNENAAVDEWSGDIGTGVKYLSQDGVIKLACLAGIEFQTSVPSERLKVVQNLLIDGSDVAAAVFSDVGVYLAYSLLYYYDFYKFENVLLMGRVMSGLGGEIIMNKANEVLKNHGADKKFRILLPDENFRRLGQSVAASYLG